MSTFKEIIYMCADQLKIASDDAFFTNDHILYLIIKYRSLLLSQKYKDVRKDIPESNYQTIQLDLMQVPAISGVPCEGGTFLKTTSKIPDILPISDTKVYPTDYFVNYDFALISRERMRFVGENKWLQNTIYCAVSPDKYMYLKSSNPQYLHLERITLTGIFEDADVATNLTSENDICDILDRTFPIEEELIPQLVEIVVKFLTSGIYKPEDTANNANDDLATLASFLRNNMKNNFQKQIES